LDLNEIQNRKLRYIQEQNLDSIDFEINQFAQNNSDEEEDNTNSEALANDKSGANKQASFLGAVTSNLSKVKKLTGNVMKNNYQIRMEEQ
jgi:hypothetical protein